MRTLWTLVAFGITAVTLTMSLAFTMAASPRPAVCLDGPLTDYSEDGRPFGLPTCGPTEVSVPSDPLLDLTPADLEQVDA